MAPPKLDIATPSGRRPTSANAGSPAVSEKTYPHSPPSSTESLISSPKQPQRSSSDDLRKTALYNAQLERRSSSESTASVSSTSNNSSPNTSPKTSPKPAIMSGGKEITSQRFLEQASNVDVLANSLSAM